MGMCLWTRAIAVPVHTQSRFLFRTVIVHNALCVSQTLPGIRIGCYSHITHFILNKYCFLSLAVFFLLPARFSWSLHVQLAILWFRFFSLYFFHTRSLYNDTLEIYLIWFWVLFFFQSNIFFFYFMLILHFCLISLLFQRFWNLLVSPLLATCSHEFIHFVFGWFFFINDRENRIQRDRERDFSFILKVSSRLLHRIHGFYTVLEFSVFFSLTFWFDLYMKMRQSIAHAYI